MDLNFKERRVLYEKHSEFFNKKIRKRFKIKPAEVSIEYLSGGTTLEKVGDNWRISRERVRQIVARTLRYVVQVNIRNKNMLTKKTRRAMTVEEIVAIYDYRKEGKSFQEISGLTNRVFNVVRTTNTRINRVLAGGKTKLKAHREAARIIKERENVPTEPHFSKPLPQPTLPLVVKETPQKTLLELILKGINAGLEEYIDQAIERKMAKTVPAPVKGELTEIDDNGVKGYYLSDIEDYLLAKDYADFIIWNEGKTGGFLNNKYYVLAEDFELFLVERGMDKYDRGMNL